MGVKFLKCSEQGSSFLSTGREIRQEGGLGLGEGTEVSGEKAGGAAKGGSEWRSDVQSCPEATVVWAAVRPGRGVAVCLWDWVGCSTLG